MIKKVAKNSSPNEPSVETKSSGSHAVTSSSQIPKPPASAQVPKPEPVASAQVPSGILNPRFWRDVVRYQFFYSIAGLTLGLTSIVGGIILFFRGVTGSTSTL